MNAAHNKEKVLPRRVLPPQRQNKIKSVFRRDMRTAKNTLRSANVRIKRLRLMSALQQTEAYQS